MYHLLWLEFANKILIFVVLLWWLLQLRETDSGFVFIIVIKGLSASNDASLTSISYLYFRSVLTKPLHGQFFGHPKHGSIVDI